jgi:penicillin-binding protein activator
MKNIGGFVELVFCVGCLVILSACVQSSSGSSGGGSILPPVFSGGQTIGDSGSVATIDKDSRDHLQAGVTMGDYKAFAEEVTNKMLASSLVQEWGATKPRIIVGDLVNNTDDENIRMKDMHDRIQETIFNSGLVRVVDKSATSFDYIIKSELTSTRQYGDSGEQLAWFTLQLKMFKIDGELVGQWSDDLPLTKGGKRFF